MTQTEPNVPTAMYCFGNRLPLLEPAELTNKQRELYDRINSRVVPAAEAAGFQSKDDQGRLLGPFNATLFSPEISTCFLTLQSTEEAHTSLSKRARQVVILTVGSVWKAPYELYAHSAAAAKTGLSPPQIEALVTGQSAAGLMTDEVAAQNFTRQLVRDYTVGKETFQAAQLAFGDRGMVEMVTLIGCYLTVCALLNAFAIPVPASPSGGKLEKSQ